MIVRAMATTDLPSLLDLQEAGAVVGMADVFPQDQYPFPRGAVLDRWRDEINDGSIGTYVAVDDDGQLVGFAATREGELLHFGTAVATWGQGVASELLVVVVDRLREATDEPTLRVFADNGRARRFYEKHGWRATGATSVSGFEPHPLLLEYSLRERSAMPTNATHGDLHPATE
jgi:ribosomal protein S18 acetylase RimI-like enzyme